jgi:hypothetical protein
MPKTAREIFFEHHFLAQTSLRTLLDRVNETLRSWRMEIIHLMVQLADDHRGSV